MRRNWLPWCFLLSFAVLSAWADGGPAFDLDGPRLDAKIMRNGKTLPIGSVASLAPGDRIWVHPDFPEQEGARYVLVVAFLRGSVNPPPENWFIKAETWNRKIRQEGLYVTVPQGAEQALVFLAPETGGDFSTLRNAVRGRPGAFVRATQDLHQASLDRARLDTYLAAIKSIDAADPKAVEAQTKLLARSLNIKVDQQCFDKPTEQQAPCLMQNPDSLVLDNGRSASIVQKLSSGADADLLSQVSYTQQAGGGYYSVYVGTVLDMAKILDSFHTAEFQYIPALAVPKGETLFLKLNNPPSFHKPQSVLVVGLPTVQSPDTPPDLPIIRAVDSKDTLCAQKAPLVLPVVGSPYVFSSSYAHDFVLRVTNRSGQNVDIPVTADPLQGGFVANAQALAAQKLPPSAKATLHGFWGFEPLNGPVFHLVSAHPESWTLASADQHALVVGRKDTVHLEGPQVACVDNVTVKDASGKKLDAAWKATKPDQIQIDLPLDGEQAGPLTLEVKQVGLEKPDQVSLHSYSEAARLDSFQLFAGDHQGVLKGARLDEVASVSVNNVVFSPSGGLSHTGSEDSLPLAAAPSADSTFHPEEKILAKVALKDGRVLDVQATVEQPRPSLKLLNKSVHWDNQESVVQLGSPDELPEHAQLTFFVQAVTPAFFPRDQKIEVAAQDGSFSTVLHLGEGGIMLQDSKTALVTLDPAKAFGASAFGPLRFRPISGQGVQGDWQPLATLVRLPQLKAIRCVEGAPLCTLEGSNLFLLETVAADPQLSSAVTVPEGFADAALNIPRPNKTLYLKLRDDPGVVNSAVVPVTMEPSQSAAISPLPVNSAPPRPAASTPDAAAPPAQTAPAVPSPSNTSQPPSDQP